MKATNVLVLVLVATLLSGCSIFTKKVDASFTPIAKPELVLPDADEVRMREIEWFIITEDNYEEVFAELQESGNVVVLLGLTSKGYENLSLNLSDIRTFVQQQQAIIKAYKGYYVESDKAMDKANEQLTQENKDKED
jgi:hypothetical protein